MPPKTLHVLSIALLALPGLSGCLSTPEAPAAVESPDVPASAAWASIPITLAGSFGARAVACPPVGCLGTPGQEQRLFELDGVKGDLARVELTLTWDAATPAMETLYFGVFTCPATCESNEDIVEMAYVDGPSPLVLDVAGFPVGEGERLHVYVSPPGRAPVLYAAATTPQEFSIEGTLTPAA